MRAARLIGDGLACEVQRPVEQPAVRVADRVGDLGALAGGERGLLVEVRTNVSAAALHKVSGQLTSEALVLRTREVLGESVEPFVEE